MAVWGNLYRNPFSGGFSALPQEHSWQRLGSYTKTGQPAIRDALRKGVTGRAQEVSKAGSGLVARGSAAARVG